MANKLSLQEAQAMNRKQRRLLSKANGGVKIYGSMKPYVKTPVGFTVSNTPQS